MGKSGNIMNALRRPTVLCALLLLVMVVTSSSAGQKSQSPPAKQTSTITEDRRAIERLHQRDISASAANDIDALSALWTNDIVSLPPGEPPIIGKAANLAFLEKGKKEYANYDIVGYSEDWQEVRQVGGFAIEWGFISTRLKPIAPGNEISARYKAIRVLKKQPDGDWRVFRAIWNAAPPESKATQ
jgi:ketosteroid isomerase-like protein